jgi:L-rhamnose mutarotase
MVTPAPAQQANIRSVRFYAVKSDRIGDFQAAVKEYNAIVTKAGSTRYYSIWASLTGASEYARVDNYTKWADLDAGLDPKLQDQAAELQRITTRISGCTESSHRIIEEVLPDLSLPGTSEMPKMIRTLQTKVRPEKVNEYLELVKNEVLPAIKKSGIKDYSVAQERYGAPSSEFLSVAGLNNWADFDGGFGVEKVMGKEGYQRFLAKLRPLILETEYNVYRFQPDLSHLPAAAK